VATGYSQDDLYWIDYINANLQHATLKKPSLDIWHQRMGHISHNALKSHGPSALTGMDYDTSSTITHVCHGCEVGKSTRKPFPVVRTPRTTRTFEIVQ
jgi:hypothetical protein